MLGKSTIPVGVAADPVRLHQFVQWLAAVAFAFAAGCVVAYVDLGEPSIGVIGLINAGFGCCLLLVGSLGVHDRWAATAGLVVAAGFMVIALAISVALPEGVLALGVLPMLAVALALRSPDRRVLLGMLVASGIAGLALGTAGDVLRRESLVAGSGFNLLRMGGQALAVVLIVYSLWQFSGLLRDALDRVAVTNAALQQAHAKLTSANDALRQQVAGVEARNREMTQLAELGEMLSSAQTEAEVSAVISRVVPPLFPGAIGAFYELDSDRTTVEAKAVWGSPPPVRRVFASTECWALRRGRIHVMDRQGAEIRCRHVEEKTATATICVPLVADSEALGVFHLQFHDAAESDDAQAVAEPERHVPTLADQERLALTLADQLELAIANFRLRETLREQSARDQLTGLFNRRYMEESLDRELRRADREGYGLGVIMIDLDHFKDLNDGFGHAAGDLMLRRAGEFLRSSIRGDDIACRFGGEEFVVILPHATIDNAERRAEALRDGMKSLEMEPAGARLPGLTMSAGVACSPDHGSTREELLAAADAALYRAKAEGRDRVVVARQGQRQAVDVLADD